MPIDLPFSSRIHLNPYWQILENSSNIFSKFQFPDHELDRFLENSSINFLWVPIQFLLNIGTWARPISGNSSIFWIQILDEFSRNRSVSRPEFFKISFSTKFSILDEFSRNRSSLCPGNLPIRVKTVLKTVLWAVKVRSRIINFRQGVPTPLS